MEFAGLSRSNNFEGSPRKAGFEFELAAVELTECAELIAEMFGGKISYKGALEAEIIDTSIGKFKVELDTQMIKNLTSKLEAKQPVDAAAVIDINELRRQLSEWIGDVASQIVPFEIVTPPFTHEQFPDLEFLRQKLQERKAEGTRSVFTNAFGMHINPDIASKEVFYIRDMLRAFLTLYPWLKEVMDIDITRRMLTFIDPFPKEYVRLILAEDYTPSLDAFIDDYLQYNPTRNRALDLLPLFAYLKPEMLHQVEEKERVLVKGRPAFHYRLPNCEIDDPNWRIARDWNYWVEVEKLAEDKEKLRSMSKDYLDFLSKPFHLFSRDWSEQMSQKYGYDT